MHKTKWLNTRMDFDFTPLGARLGVSGALTELLVKRGIKTEEKLREYLYPDKKGFHSPWLMKDMEKGCETIRRVAAAKGSIRIIGDYDADGVMSTAILMKGLSRLGMKVSYQIPDRVKDGYGIRDYMAEQAKEDGVSLILTCDNGISAMEAVKKAKELGMEVVITDHHDIPYTEEGGEKIYQIPPADAVINPKQEDCPYPCKILCGAAVAYKLIEALYEKEGRDITKETDLLVFAAIATVCDVMPLVEENRILVKYGLEKIKESGNCGLTALLQEKGLMDKKITAYHMGFIIGPCINAAGRMDTAQKSLHMFLAEEEEAEKLAGELAQLNEERKEVTLQAEKEAIKTVEEKGMNTDRVLLLYLPDCHESIAGIVAGRIRERYYKPTLVAVRTQKGVKGSGRSIPEYSMYGELNKCKELLTEFGGHHLAAGFSLAEENVEAFRKCLNERTELSEEDLVEKIRIDLHMPLGECTLSFVEETGLLEPFGQENKKPLFAATGLTITKADFFGKDRNMLRLTAREKDLPGSFSIVDFAGSDTFQEILEEKYGKGSFEKLLSGEEKYGMDLLYQPDIREYNGVQTVQFIAKGYR